MSLVEFEVEPGTTVGEITRAEKTSFAELWSCPVVFEEDALGAVELKRRPARCR